MKIYLGVPVSFKRFGAVAAEIGASVLVSANALRKRNKFRPVPANLFGGVDVALDSAGYVAMARYGDYPWTVSEYVALAASFPWDWWASMDFCCEPQIARNREEVRHRYEMTVSYLGICRYMAAERGIKPPMPVLQGWNPSDYLRCAERMGDLPALVGIGSVCRRHVGGAAGLVSIIDALDQRLPAHVRFHLFGVKGDGIAALRGLPRIASIDSMAWDFACRREHKAEGWKNFSIEARSTWMRRWHAQQMQRLSEPCWVMQRELFAA